MSKYVPPLSWFRRSSKNRMEKFTLITAKQYPEVRSKNAEFARAVWPEYMHHEPISNAYWRYLYEYWPEYQFVLRDSGSETVVAMGNSVPLYWDKDFSELPDEGWDWIIPKAVEDLEHDRQPNLHVALQVIVAPEFQGQGISKHAVMGMKRLGKSRGFSTLIVPVRPTQKTFYPLTPIDRYIWWKNGEGLPFDPWLRVHVKLGAEILKSCHQAMTVKGTIKDWEDWAHMKFPESGDYVVPGALVPIQIDCQSDEGIYVEPNVWVKHSLQT